MHVPNAPRLSIAALGLALLAGCGGASEPDTPPRVNVASCPATVIPLTQPEIDEASFMREEETLARDVYLDLAEHWTAQAGQVPVVTIMSNISQAEQEHMDSMKAVLDCYGLPDPMAAGETRGVFINTELAQLYTDLIARGQTSQGEALHVGALIEEVDIEDLVTSIAISQQDYTDQVYENLMCGSRNHLRAFAGEIIKTEGRYTAQRLDQAEVDAIVNSPSERCGR